MECCCCVYIDYRTCTTKLKVGNKIYSPLTVHVVNMDIPEYGGPRAGLRFRDQSRQFEISTEKVVHHGRKGRD